MYACFCYVRLSFFPIPSQEISLGKRLQNDLFCVEWDVKHTHTHPFNGPLSGTTRVSQYQKGKTNLDFTEARDSEWQ